ncbi:CDP-alcohol phosphatidyltransferase family protein [Roseospira navarrensis]|uniref:CDP-alcohol phosphatidyltransferase n=1 Tax=Roseospira navarrensis TaxID=140058 RepID=A0A7X1ZBW6_9PROT|nr:CDP-alcohol phosphatidyltransferase family protein [Roseospira navarrensis]MQX35705.1 CDP-alcohol phosphatidyltransferase [Roseospira navarrensis]
MLSTQDPPADPRFRSRPTFGPEGPTGAFVSAALFGALGVVALSAVLPGAGVLAGAMALALYLVGATLAGRALARTYPFRRLGLCNLVTLGRLALVGALVAPTAAGVGPSWAVLAVAVVALTLDGVDGWMARRYGLVSAFGARFDMEVDSAFALVLALNAAIGSEAGALVVLLGLPRYAFLAAGMACPWMRPALPDRFSRKVVAVAHMAALIAMQAPLLPPSGAAVMAAAVAGLVGWSFARDILWLWRGRA